MWLGVKGNCVCYSCPDSQEQKGDGDKEKLDVSPGSCQCRGTICLKKYSVAVIWYVVFWPNCTAMGFDEIIAHTHKEEGREERGRKGERREGEREGGREGGEKEEGREERRRKVSLCMIIEV